MNGVLCVSLDRKLLCRCSRKLSRLHARGLIIGSENWLDDGSTVYAIKATDKGKKIEKYDSLGIIKGGFLTNLHVFHSRKKS